MKKILIVSYSFPPSNAAAAQRPFFLAKYFPEYGYHPIVLTPENAHSAQGSSNWTDTSDIEIVKTKNVDLSGAQKLRNKNYNTSAGKKKGASRLAKVAKSSIEYLAPRVCIPDRAFLWKKYAIEKGREICTNNKIEAVISTNPAVTNHLIAEKLSDEFGMKWIADFRDFYYTGNYEDSAYLRRVIDSRIEKRILKKAEHITMISPKMKDHIVDSNKHISNKSTVIYNGFDPNEYSDGQNSIELREDKLTIFYAGSFYRGVRNPLPLFQALDSAIEDGLISSDKVEVSIAGNLDKELLKDINRYKSSACLTLLGVIPRKEVIEIYKRTHLLWLIIGDHISHYLGFPVKGYEYMGTKRPMIVFAPNNSQAEDIIDDIDNGYFLSSGMDTVNQQANAQTMKTIIKDFNKCKLQSPCIYPDDAIKKYHRKYQTQQFAEILHG